MEGVVNMALNKIGKVGNRAEIPINGKKAYVSTYIYNKLNETVIK